MPPRENQRAMGMRQGQALIRSHGTEVRQVRLRAGLTQREFCRAAGVSTTYLGRFESGRQRHLDPPTLTAMYALLGHRLSVRAFPVRRPLRDAGHLRLLNDSTPGSALLGDASARR